MTEAVIDFETRSTVNIQACGASVYAADPTTEVICLSLALDTEEPIYWVAPKFLNYINPSIIPYTRITDNEVRDIMTHADKIIAQNAQFEWLIWQYKMTLLFGWPEPVLEKFHDTMAQLAYCALPMNLDMAGQALNLTKQKDSAGHAIMLKLCKPRNPRKAEREANPDWENTVYWYEDQSDYETLILYCCRDVETEREVYKVLPQLPVRERDIWLLNERINQRGVPIDVDSVLAITQALEKHEITLLSKFQEAVNGEVSGPRSYVALKDWVNKEMGTKIGSLDKNATDRLLKNADIPENVKTALEIKAELSKSSVSKLSSMLDRMLNGRVQGWSAYHAAATGRWAAWGLQLHNQPRDSYKPKAYEMVVDLFKREDLEGLSLLWDEPYQCASRCVRGSIASRPGYVFICTDFSSVEGRGLAFLAGEQWVLEAYKKDEDMYKHAAAMIFGIPYDQIDDKQRQVGKVSELALGYAGGIGAYASMAKGYGVDLESLPALILPRATQEETIGPYGAVALAKMYLRKNPVMSLEAATACDVIKRKWRSARPMIVRFWAMMEQCALAAIESQGKVIRYRDLKFCVNDDFLKIMLPSGRVLHYFKPRIAIKETDWGESRTITFMGMKIIEGKTTRQWARLTTFGGKLTENIVQGFCRDLLADAMLRHEKAGYPIILHVHDEDMAEVPEGQEDMEEFNRIMEVVPFYAQGMPIKAEGWIGKRYRK